MNARFLRHAGCAAAAAFVVALASSSVPARAAVAVPVGALPPSVMLARTSLDYVETYLVSDGFLAADHTDSHLVNAWGLAASPTGPWWVADNGTDDSTLYDGSGTPQSLVVSIPGPPTGTVYYGGSSITVSDGTSTGPARFLFASEDGRIYGWSPAVPSPAPSTQAFVFADRSSDGAIYKGLAVATTMDGDFLYATDFHNGRVDVFDSTGKLVTTRSDFRDPGIPATFAPFGVQNVMGRIVVTYAMQDADREDEIAGRGLGYVSVFEPDGTFLSRVATRGLLDAPWGVALAPPSFGRFGGDLLIGNFGDGKINAFAMTDDMRRFRPRGQLRDDLGHVLSIDGLWGLAFGNGGAAGAPNQLFFAAGPDDEGHGVFGRIDVAR